MVKCLICIMGVFVVQLLISAALNIYIYIYIYIYIIIPQWFMLYCSNRNTISSQLGLIVFKKIKLQSMEPRICHVGKNIYKLCLRIKNSYPQNKNLLPHLFNCCHELRIHCTNLLSCFGKCSHLVCYNFFPRFNNIKKRNKFNKWNELISRWNKFLIHGHKNLIKTKGKIWEILCRLICALLYF